MESTTEARTLFQRAARWNNKDRAEFDKLVADMKTSYLEDMLSVRDACNALLVGESQIPLLHRGQFLFWLYECEENAHLRKKRLEDAQSVMHKLDVYLASKTAYAAWPAVGIDTRITHLKDLIKDASGQEAQSEPPDHRIAPSPKSILKPDKKKSFGSIGRGTGRTMNAIRKISGGLGLDLARRSTKDIGPSPFG